MELRPPPRTDASQPVDIYTASPGFFETMGVPHARAAANFKTRRQSRRRRLAFPGAHLLAGQTRSARP